MKSIQWNIDREVGERSLIEWTMEREGTTGHAEDERTVLAFGCFSHLRGEYIGGYSSHFKNMILCRYLPRRTTLPSIRVKHSAAHSTAIQ